MAVIVGTENELSKINSSITLGRQVSQASVSNGDNDIAINIDIDIDIEIDFYIAIVIDIGICSNSDSDCQFFSDMDIYK